VEVAKTAIRTRVEKDARFPSPFSFKQSPIADLEYPYPLTLMQNDNPNRRSAIAES